MKLADIFNKQFGAAFLVIMGGLLAISPAGLQQANQLTPKELAATITSNTAFVSVEEVAAWLIDKRPDLIRRNIANIIFRKHKIFLSRFYLKKNHWNNSTMIIPSCSIPTVTRTQLKPG